MDNDAKFLLSRNSRSKQVTFQMINGENITFYKKQKDMLINHQMLDDVIVAYLINELLKSHQMDRNIMENIIVTNSFFYIKVYNFYKKYKTSGHNYSSLYLTQMFADFPDGSRSLYCSIKN